MPPPPTPPLELLAPAGDFSCLRAALEAGADAVYLGLTSLNARRRARNFSAGELAQACELAHGLGRRIYLTLNVELAQGELAEAARVLELARRCQVDAVLVRDPALLAFKPHFPELELHFSTQACITSSADAEAARELGLTRVVLAREMTLEEIAAASAVSGVESEVFAQGALCFCVSGRCLLASWVGGRSGNRGQCTSPCRVPWTADGEPAGTPFSMHDLSVATRVEELRRAGVRALTIEGRLKTAAWVRAAVSLYRKAIDGSAAGEELAREAQALGAYTGRQLTCGYLDGKRENLTGRSGRERADARSEGAAAAIKPEASAGYALDVEIGKRIRCRWSYLESTEEFELSRAEVRRAEKAVKVSALLERLEHEPVDGVQAGELRCNEPGALLVPRTANAIEQRVQAAVRRALRVRRQLEVPLAPAIQQILALADHCSQSGVESKRRADRARLTAMQASGFLASVQPTAGTIIEGLHAEGLRSLVAAGHRKLIAALPQVFFEEDRASLQSLLVACAELGVVVEANSWGGWLLSKRAGVRLLAGPGLGVLNSLAARELSRLGFQEVTASVEADATQLESLLRCSPVPCTVVVFGRPALMTTRAALPKQLTDRTLEDRRQVRLRSATERGLLQLRPLQPFDLRSTSLPAGAAHQVVDLVGSEDPLAEWQLREGSPGSSTFNTQRTLA
ncbi:MAG: U32 family peptidase [Deltaproteobacteria bacterium]|nr:U32 family peptidase [Deltaproteobacteria bacterium]